MPDTIETSTSESTAEMTPVTVSPSELVRRAQSLVPMIRERQEETEANGRVSAEIFGAICDAEGTIWTAQWGSGRVAGYTPMGDFAAAVDLPARQVTCPALGGADMAALNTGLIRLPRSGSKSRAVVVRSVG